VLEEPEQAFLLPFAIVQPLPRPRPVPVRLAQPLGRPDRAFGPGRMWRPAATAPSWGCTWNRPLHPEV
jgi:hypothetical protein